MSPHLRTSSVIIPAYLQNLFAELCERSGFDVLHTSRQLDGVDDETLKRKFEMLGDVYQSGSVIDSVRICLRNQAGVELTFTWGVFDEDLPSANVDDSPKSRFEQNICFAGATDLTPVFSALAAAGFEPLSPDANQNFSIRFIRGQAMAGKMRLGINANLDYGAEVAGRGCAMRAQ
ncbi:MAG: hypothetical protein P4L53_05210 [Candidatus Obscuribacterales bacterium]|nr:hypothetical protein [Candidatus Obscuribacterales bacterium]